MEILWMLIVGGIIGWIASLITGRDVPGGIIGNIIAGFIGAWLGGLILGNWGPVVGGFAIIPAIIGSIILVLIVSFIMRKMGQKNNHGHHA
ncbi:GlsB/YeaQ/YmgE family stress response membrane protein [Priestia megaterium]|uniref:Transglycosylase associated family protein n=1 Tax=Priestia megaterium (strain ATCC 14581 / DSM 32 / CCUG 1817 / JCM 2506 / NBRC 15308 / NCIMB 9376 / NCTC 10342 / NRRL B-14308 / VKM B-512 / Ford 19) TaxID=1348623 RepID=A0A0B6ATQ4_PRIM2|nr:MULTISPECIES: GlsB/YeaQ/YmgE family stress response membrane protein [Priestia]AJI24517.1 transglycosylase associated family protein [Priestia megaterium NBRC 15308 = ATCC 14581]KFN06265.1 transglycosylase associated family protein [Priestia megaterium]KGJ81189.1 membrane protein [Priestia megaterium NBRC 15308 = ATCC 14581]MCU7709581.1 GlsB/YeaQ/YmgE family stress response membrane protein [Priestia megaterium]MCW1047129.1 GlsB/YeaQ/YmgE family stress response membrane protein [Priestia sp